MISPEKRIEQYQLNFGKMPSPHWLATTAKVPLDVAENLINGGNNESKSNQKNSENPKKPPRIALDGQPVSRGIVSQEVATGNMARNQAHTPHLIDRAVLALTGAMQNVAFFFASLADLALAVFFYWSLGFDPVSKTVLAIWGFVQTAGKLWAWSNGRNIIAGWAAILSIVATLSVFLAVIDTQSATVKQGDSQAVVMLNRQIVAKEGENKALTARIRDTPSDYISAVKALSATMADNDKILAGLRAELDQAGKETKNRFQLDAWKIFSQLTNFAWNDPSHIFALLLILAIATLFEMLIYATTPRKV